MTQGEDIAPDSFLALHPAGVTRSEESQTKALNKLLCDNVATHIVQLLSLRSLTSKKVNSGKLSLAMIHFFVLLKPLGKKKLNKDAEGGKKAIIFPHQEESNYSHVSALLVY